MNEGEARVTRALYSLGVKPSEVEQQFRLGPYRIDFAFVPARVALESDGWVHTTTEVRRRDRKRDKALRCWGWITVRVDGYQDEGKLRDAVAVAVRLALGEPRRDPVSYPPVYSAPARRRQPCGV